MSKGMVIAVIKRKRLAARRVLSRFDIITPSLRNSIIGRHTQLKVHTRAIRKSLAPGRPRKPWGLDLPLKIGRPYDMASSPVKLRNPRAGMLSFTANGISASADIRVIA